MTSWGGAVHKTSQVREKKQFDNTNSISRQKRDIVVMVASTPTLQSEAA